MFKKEQIVSRRIAALRRLSLYEPESQARNRAIARLWRIHHRIANGDPVLIGD